MVAVSEALLPCPFCGSPTTGHNLGCELRRVAWLPAEDVETLRECFGIMAYAMAVGDPRVTRFSAIIAKLEGDK